MVNGVCSFHTQASSLYITLCLIKSESESLHVLYIILYGCGLSASVAALFNLIDLINNDWDDKISRPHAQWLRDRDIWSNRSAPVNTLEGQYCGLNIPQNWRDCNS